MSKSSIAKAGCRWDLVVDMADHPELWTESTPERRYRFDRAPTFGLARDAERMQHEVPAARVPARGRKRGRDRGPFVTYLRLPWSYGDRNRGEFWHRLQCRRRRHEMAGGHTIQLGSTVVFIERRCRWCGVGPES